MEDSLAKWGKMTKSKSEGGMGFHDLALHIDSLLAKQAWLLLQDKSHYFIRSLNLASSQIA